MLGNSPDRYSLMIKSLSVGPICQFWYTSWDRHTLSLTLFWTSSSFHTECFGSLFICTACPQNFYCNPYHFGTPNRLNFFPPQSSLHASPTISKSVSRLQMHSFIWILDTCWEWCNWHTCFSCLDIIPSGSPCEKNQNCCRSVILVQSWSVPILHCSDSCSEHTWACHWTRLMFREAVFQLLDHHQDVGALITEASATVAEVVQTEQGDVGVQRAVKTAHTVGSNGQPPSGEISTWYAGTPQLPSAQNVSVKTASACSSCLSPVSTRWAVTVVWQPCSDFGSFSLCLQLEKHFACFPGFADAYQWSAGMIHQSH